MITFPSFIQPAGHQLNYAFGWIITESGAMEGKRLKWKSID